MTDWGPAGSRAVGPTHSGLPRDIVARGSTSAVGPERYPSATQLPHKRDGRESEAPSCGPAARVLSFEDS
jgi:hypothetical protein